ncbi:hypothetical protein BGX27_007111 [Mortierella sp. AM989]|nr:hypothetical protein BGX27_007111 [Mortierella sp. AM989]
MEPQDQAHLPQPHGDLSHCQLTHHDRDLHNPDPSDRQEGHGVSQVNGQGPSLVKNSPFLTSDSSLPSSLTTINKTSSSNNNVPSGNAGQNSSPRTLHSTNPPTASSILPTRIPGTPPANPPPRFFTRPYRRTQDHNSHHHNSSIHSSGHGAGQNSSSIGVRSAFKDFIVPAQIILVCSILNALWPTMLWVTTTAIEFLVLVLSSYGACARRSDDCYFLEPLFHDGQEAIYVAAIQWTLRSILVILFLSGLYIATKKVQQVRSVLATNQRHQSLWIFENLWSWVMTYPKLLWAYIVRMLPWKISRSFRSSTQNRSTQGMRHQRKMPSLMTSASSTDQRKYQSSPKGRGNTANTYARRTGASSAVASSAADTDAFSAGSGSESKARSKTKSRKSRGAEAVIQRNANQPGADSAGQSPLSSISLADAVESTAPVASIETVSLPDLKTPATATSNLEVNGSSTAGIVSNALYETADDGEFISTDRRRRRKAKGGKGSITSNSSDSLVKTSLPPPATQSVKPESELDTAKPNITFQDSITPQEQTLDRVQHQYQPKVQDAEATPIQLQPATPTNGKEEQQQLPLASEFVHPLHALNSTSPIVRLKPSHKRSQSAQLPLPSPWGKPQLEIPNGNHNHPSSLSQVISLNDSKDTPTANSGSEQTESCNFKNYDLFGEPSIWYSPFQSGLDISIESDQEQGKHGSRPLSKPKIQINGSSSQRKPNLPPSSFFESSPRTPRIMPFSQHHNGNTLGTEDWSIRSKSSSVAVPMTPVLESDCQDHMEYFGGSRSANSSRRGSVENNLTESLLSGRTRMFGEPTPSAGHSRQNSQYILSPSGTSNGITPEASYLSPHFSSAIVPTTLNSIGYSNSPTLGQSPISSPMLMATNSSDTVSGTAPTFVNPWEPGFTYNLNQSLSETFLPFETSSASHSLSRDSERDRQSSLLRLMNGDSGNSTATLDDEKEAIQRGFLFPSLTHLAHPSLPSTETSNFQPFDSMELSLAVANHPSPLVGDHRYDTPELAIQDPTKIQASFVDSSLSPSRRETNEKKPKDRYRHGRTHSGHHKSSSLGSFFPPFPPVSNVSKGSTSAIETSASIAHDPLGRSAQPSEDSSRGNSSQGHGNIQSKQGRHYGPGRETDGTSGRRKAGTDHDTQVGTTRNMIRASQGDQPRRNNSFKK